MAEGRVFEKMLEMQAKKRRHGRLKVKGETIKYSPRKTRNLRREGKEKKRR